MSINPVADIERPAINREGGSTLAFSKAQARKLLDAPSEDSIAGLRDRALNRFVVVSGTRYELSDRVTDYVNEADRRLHPDIPRIRCPECGKRMRLEAIEPLDEVRGGTTSFRCTCGFTHQYTADQPE